MMNRAQAQITWLSATEGGRKSPPTGNKYTTVAQFGDETLFWSLILESNEALNKAQSIIATIHFLADDKQAPLHLLLPGNRFKLLEGPKVVASGIIVDSSEAEARNGVEQVQLDKGLIKV